MSQSIFSSNRLYLDELSVKDVNDNQKQIENVGEFLSNVEVKLKTAMNLQDEVILDLIAQLDYALKEGEEAAKKEFLASAGSGYAVVNELVFQLIHSNPSVQKAAYLTLDSLVSQLDHDELVETMMDRLICISWEYEDENDFFNFARLSTEYVELFGKGLERMTKARDWMLFLPFLTNYVTKTINAAEDVLLSKSIFCSLSGQKEFSKWDQAVVLISNNCLDLAEFICKRTVNQPIFEFPSTTTNIGTENGDTKRRYLGYYILALVYEKIIANFDMKLADIYFKSFYATYTIKHRTSDANEDAFFKEKVYKPAFDIVHRAMNLAECSGATCERLYLLQLSLFEMTHNNCTSKDEDDRQMINSRLYPLSCSGIATLFSLSLFDSKIRSFSGSTASEQQLFPRELKPFLLAKKYIGIVLNLVLVPDKLIEQTDKGMFVMLYFADNIEISNPVTAEDIQKDITGPCGNEIELPASKIVEVISSVAATCPSPSIRFISYRLLDKFLSFGDDTMRTFIMIELLDRCPFPSMKTAAIGLLKDQINRAFREMEERKRFEPFASPLIVKDFFPIIFRFKSSWESNHTSFWDDSDYIMQALNIYLYLLIRDKKKNLTTVWNGNCIKSIREDYLEPLSKTLNMAMINKEDEGFGEMQKQLMEQVINDILTRIGQ